MVRKELFHSPVLTPDFMLNFLTVGPGRMWITRERGSQLPLLTDIEQLELIPPELIAAAQKKREEREGLSEHLIRRQVRDEIDAARIRLGPVALGGMAKMEIDLAEAIQVSAMKRAETGSVVIGEHERTPVTTTARARPPSRR